MGFFSKRKKIVEEESVESADKIKMIQIEDEDEEAARIVDNIKDGIPVVINFAKLEFSAANKMLGFFTGATYALGGRYVRINEISYLFAREEEFEDGSLDDFINSL